MTRTSGTRGAVACLSMLAMLLGKALWAQPQSALEPQVPKNPAVASAPAQPIPFSHKKHLSLDLQCSTCHSSGETGGGMALPAASICMNCHEVVATEKPSIMKLAEFAKSQQPIPWVRVYILLPGVHWSHGKHLEAGVKCETCHGAVADLEAMAMVTSITSMGSCIHCHQAMNAKTACNTCHLWP